MDIGTKQNKNTFPESPYVLKAEEINQIVAELQYIITLAEIVLDSTDTTQVYQALQVLFASVAYPDQTGNGFKVLQTDGASPFWGSLNPAGECSTAGATEAKTVAITNFVLSNYCRVTVKFTNANTGATPTLNVEGTGAKTIKVLNTTSTKIYIPAGAIVDFIYDGTDWTVDNKIIESYYNSDTWYKRYIDGFIEQGSVTAISGNDGDGIKSVTVNLPVAMSTSNYSVSVTADSAYCYGSYGTRNTGTVVVSSTNRAGNVAPAGNVIWSIKGY